MMNMRMLLTATLTAKQIKTIGIELEQWKRNNSVNFTQSQRALKVPNQNKKQVQPQLMVEGQNYFGATGNTVSKGKVLATISNASFISNRKNFKHISKSRFSTNRI